MLRFFLYAASVKTWASLYLYKRKNTRLRLLDESPKHPARCLSLLTVQKKKMATYTKKFTILLNVHTPTTHSLEMPLTFYYFFSSVRRPEPETSTSHSLVWHLSEPDLSISVAGTGAAFGPTENHSPACLRGSDQTLRCGMGLSPAPLGLGSGSALVRLELRASRSGAGSALERWDLVMTRARPG